MPDEERKFRKQHMTSDHKLLTYGLIPKGQRCPFRFRCHQSMTCGEREAEESNFS